MKRLRLPIRDLIRRDRFEHDMRDELEAYLDLSAEDHQRQGKSAAEARRAARLELGGLEQARERLRAERTGMLLDTLWQDVRHALRFLRRQPGFALVAMCTLALGIGANTAVISVVRSVLLAPLPFADADRLVRLRVIETDATGRDRELSLVPAYFTAIRERSRLIERVAAQRFHNLTLHADGAADRVIGNGVSDQWAETLGVSPLVGRSFSLEEQREGSTARVVLLAHGFWLRRFGGDAAVLGRSIRLNAESYVVIGVMPPEFRYPYESDLWFPISISPTAISPNDLNAPARLKAGVTSAELDRELATLADALAREFPLSNSVRLVGVPMHVEFARDPDRAIAALSVAVALVLLLACVNLATLLMARGHSRTRELALRAAIGASRGRQIRQLLTESTIVAAIGGLAGVLIAAAVTRWLGALIPARLSEVIQQVHVDGATLAVAAVLILATGVATGVVPALRLTALQPSDILKDGGRPGSRRGQPLLQLLVAGEAALAMVILAAAAVMAQNFARLLSADIGYSPVDLTRINISLSDPSYADPARRTTVIRQIVERVNAVHGVTAAGVTNLQPIPRVRANFGASLDIDRATPPGFPRPVVNRRLVTPAYFTAMGVRIVAGRTFSESDSETSEPVAIVNEAAARRFWPDQDPIGRHVRPGPQSASWHTVIGVASNMGEPEEAIAETIYQPYAQANATLPPGVWVTTNVSLMVRGPADRARLVGAIREAIRAVDPGLPLFDIADMATALTQPLSAQRLGATMFVLFGAFGLTLAVLGTYGVVAFSVGRRVSEFAVRLALGAAPAALVRRIVSDGLRPVVIGLVAGVIASWLLSPLVATAVTEADPRDPATLVAVAIVLLLTAAAACLAPAVRVLRINPVMALRHE